MSKRLVRLSNKEILANLSKIQDKELNVVAFSGQTYFGQFVSCSEDLFVVKDFRSHEHRLALNDIEKVIYDQEASW